MEKDYLIQKKPFAALVLFSLPIVVGNLFQQTYTLADSAIVGRYDSQQALAAVGACNARPIFSFVWRLEAGLEPRFSSALVFRRQRAREDGHGYVYHFAGVSDFEHSAGNVWTLAG